MMLIPFWRIRGITHDTQHKTAQHNTAQHNTIQRNSIQHSTIQRSTIQYSTALNSTIQHKSGKHEEAQCRAAENINSRLNTPCQKNNRIKSNQSNVESYKYGNAQ